MVVFDMANLFAVCLYNNFNFEMFSIPNLITNREPARQYRSLFTFWALGPVNFVNYSQ